MTVQQETAWAARWGSQALRFVLGQPAWGEAWERVLKKEGLGSSEGGEFWEDQGPGKLPGAGGLGTFRHGYLQGVLEAVSCSVVVRSHNPP